jgi:hypothetical protein
VLAGVPLAVSATRALAFDDSVYGKKVEPTVAVQSLYNAKSTCVEDG